MFVSGDDHSPLRDARARTFSAAPPYLSVMLSISLLIFASCASRSSAVAGAPRRAAATSSPWKYHRVTANLSLAAASTSCGTRASDLNSTSRPPSGATSVRRTGFFAT